MGLEGLGLLYCQPESEEKQLLQGRRSGTCWVFPTRGPTLPVGDLRVSGPLPLQAPCLRMGSVFSAGPDSGTRAPPPQAGHAMATCLLAMAAPESEPAASNAKQAGEWGAGPGRAAAQTEEWLCYDGFRCWAAPLSASPQPFCPPKALLLLSFLL